MQTDPHAWHCPAHLTQTGTVKRRRSRNQRPVSAAHRSLRRAHVTILTH